MNPSETQETGVTDVRRAREAIAKQHDGNLAQHAAESARIASELQDQLHLGPTIQPPARRPARFRTQG